MIREDVVAVASRLFAIYVILNILKNAPSTALLISQDGGMGWATLYALALVLGLALCAYLWFFPLTIARRLLPVMREPRSEQVVDASVALSLGLTLIGVWLLANAVIDSLYWLTLFLHTRRVSELGFEWSSDQLANMAATASQLVISLWLLLGSTGIKRLIQKYRYGEL